MARAEARKPARMLVLPGLVPAWLWCASCAAQDSASGIPYRQEAAATSSQLVLGYGLALLLLVVVVLVLAYARKRLAGRIPGLAVNSPDLQWVASLRLPMRTMVHVVAWRGREFVFAQCADRMEALAQFDTARADGRDASP
ncbi:hypothetical protein [Lacisediminimonas profundi]|uniref:hypothetical protein n=1 Tax=Lacisediminimonas profundi TaxID=2603856 RepID=UPI00124B4BFD|nr:hypothetical protein [Lacisediminimonas profundi]